MELNKHQEGAAALSRGRETRNTLLAHGNNHGTMDIHTGWRGPDKTRRCVLLTAETKATQMRDFVFVFLSRGKTG